MTDPSEVNTVVATRYTPSPAYEELPAGEAGIEPGMGVEITTDASGEQVVQPVSSTGYAATRFAREQRSPPFAGNGTLTPVEQAYDEQNVETELFRAGDELRARIASGTDLEDSGTTETEANHADLTAGETYLDFHDDGTLREAQDRSDAVAVARESVDNSGAAAGEHTLALVQVI